MQAPPGRGDAGRQWREWRLSRRRFVARAVRLGCSASSVAGLLAACTPTAPTATGAPPIPTVTSASRASGTAVPPTTRAAGSPTIATAPAGTVGTAAAAPLATPTQAVAVEPLPASGLAWLRQRAIPFATAEPGGDAADLAPFTRLVGDARLVALGEATHGTHEFLAMKHRLFEFLVRELGFTGFAIEANGPEAERIDDYVQTGQGDPASLLAGLHYWPWNTREVLDLIGWLRAYNAQRGSAPAVSFHGFDMPFPNLALEQVLAYVRQVDAPAVEHFTALYATFRPYAIRQLTQVPRTYPREAPAIKARCRDGVRQAHDDLSGRRAAYSAASSPRAFARALQHARIVVQAEEDWAADDREARAALRDRFMAENAAWAVEQAGPDAKVVLWAHNEHIGTTSIAGSAVASMGMHLRERYGTALVTCGFDFYAGSCNANGGGGVAPQEVPPPPADSYAAAFRQAHLARLLLDLRGLSPGAEETAWLVGPRRFRSIGAGYNAARPDDYLYAVNLPQKFDVLIYFQETSPSALLPG